MPFPVSSPYIPCSQRSVRKVRSSSPAPAVLDAHIVDFLPSALLLVSHPASTPSPHFDHLCLLLRLSLDLHTDLVSRSLGHLQLSGGNPTCAHLSLRHQLPVSPVWLLPHGHRPLSYPSCRDSFHLTFITLLTPVIPLVIHNLYLL